MESSLKNMVLVLFTITLLSSAAVGGVYLITKEPIAQAKEAAVNDALSRCFQSLRRPQSRLLR